MKRIVFAMSDTGGGHRAAADAISEALKRLYGEANLDIKLVDIFKHYCYFPLNTMPDFYPLHVKYSKGSYGMTFNMTNTRRRARILSKGMFKTNQLKLKRLPIDYPADTVVSVHSILTRPTFDAYRRYSDQNPALLTVVTDLISTHYLWYDKRTDVTMVPTEIAYDRGIEAGLDADQLLLTGLPVNPSFLDAIEDVDKSTIRADLKWDPNLPAILMVAGGDGMGTIYETARAVDARKLKCQLIIIAGKNDKLKEKLESASWNQPTLIYPFIRNMPQLMLAADILVTKAGPATICEAMIAGLPIIISDLIPGQEEGNVDFVIQNEAGVFAPKPRLVADALEEWLSNGADTMHRLTQNAHACAKPDAVWEIARQIGHSLQLEPLNQA
ncbi:glycosyltransferase [Anaerolineales bacterium]